jgi:tRNA pseudouridine38-40 synthase
VRSIVGTLLRVGQGRLSPEEFEAILTSRDRSKAGPTAPAHGLCLVEVRY